MEDLDFIPPARALVKYNFPADALKTATATPAVPTPIVQQYSWMAGNIAPWGTDNLLPQHILSKSLENPIIAPVIEEKADLLAQADYVIGKVSYQEGKKTFVPTSNPEIEQFLADINFDDYKAKAALHYYWFGNVFPEIVTSIDGKKIVNLTAHDSTFCRYSRQNEYGLITHCFINANWHLFANESHHYTLIRQVIQKDIAPTQDLWRKIANSKDRNFIYPLSQPKVGTTFYAACSWHTALTSKVVEWANAIPQYKAAIMRNQLSADFLVEISTEYWTDKYPDWHEKPELKEERKKAIRKEIEETLTGAENASKSIFAPMGYDEYNKKEIHYIKITPISKTNLDGRLVEDSQEACSLLLFALRMPADLLGNLPSSSGMGAGSGSPTREHFNIYFNKIAPHQQLILEPLNRLIFPYNGWNGYEIRFQNPNLQTLNQVTPSKRDL